jgi:hypothetical protein
MLPAKKTHEQGWYAKNRTRRAEDPRCGLAFDLARSERGHSFF